MKARGLRTVWLWSVLQCATACAVVPAAPPVATSDLRLLDADSHTHRVSELLTRAPWTVVVFFSATCPTVAAHDQRLIDLWRAYQGKEVAWLMVASESDVTLAALVEEQKHRGYPFPLLWDTDATFARGLGVRYASQAFILDHEGNVAYAGSIDSDRRFLHDDAEPYLKHALDALLAGSAPPRTPSAAYGCALALER